VPVPPAVGSRGDLRGSELVILDCVAPHAVEVTYTWTADVPAAGRPTFGLCADKVRSYVGSPPAQDADAHEPGGWSVPLRYRQVVATGPKGSNIQDWSWQACLVAPMGPAPSSGYQGQVRATPSTGPASSALRVCYTDPGAALAVVPCTSPHIGEVIATQPLPAAQSASTVDAPMSVTTPVTSCATAARSVTGAADPTVNGQLRVTVLSDQLAKIPFGADIGVYYTAQVRTGRSGRSRARATGGYLTPWQGSRMVHHPHRPSNDHLAATSQHDSGVKVAKVLRKPVEECRWESGGLKIAMVMSRTGSTWFADNGRWWVVRWRS